MTAITDRSYDAFIEPKTPGMWELGTLGTALVFSWSMVAIFAMKFLGVWWGIGLLAAGLILLGGVAKKDEHHRSKIQRKATDATWARADKKGSTRYVPGPFTRFGSFLLPGILALSEATERKDMYGHPYMMIRMPQVNHYAVTWEAHPDGSSIRNVDDVGTAVDKWGGWLSFLCEERGAIQVQVTIRDTPDHGHVLRNGLLGRQDPTAPGMAKQIAGELADQYSKGTPRTRAFVTVTWEGDQRGTKRGVEEMSAALGSRLPRIGAKLSATGAGACTLVDAQTMTEVVRSAYDPGCERALADAKAARQPIGLRWDSIGPVAADDYLRWYQHCGYYSICWVMTNINGAVNEGSMIPLLSPDTMIERKSTSFVYRLREPGVAEAIATGDVTTADFTINTTRGEPSAKVRKRKRAAELNADHEAHSHGIVDVAIIQTATVASLDDIPEAESLIDSKGPAARLRLRRTDGTHGFMFAHALPGFGIVAHAYSKIHPALRESL